MSDYADLIDKLSEAKEGGRELDALVWCTMNEGWMPGKGVQLGAVIKPGRGPTGGSMRSPERTTTSVDAILALIEKRLPDADFDLQRRMKRDEINGALWYSPERNVWFHYRAATPALALCVAFLSALSRTPPDADLSPGRPTNSTPSHRQGGETT